MIFINGSDFENNTYTHFGPMEIGYQEETDTIKTILSVFLGLTMVVSVVGNVCTCAVIVRDRTMRTPTNCYLLNLAITDLLTALFIPLEIYFIWIPEFYPFGEEGCRFHYALWDCLSNSSVLTISAFTVERYLVISKPFLRQKLFANSRVFKIIAVNWLIACSFCIPDLFYIDLLERKKYVFCYITISKHLEVLLAVDIFVFFVVPMTIITVLYVLIALKLKSTHSKLRNSPVTGNQGRDKAVKMLAAVAATFFFCWAPFCMYRIMMLTPTYKDDDYYNMWRILNYLCAINVYMSTAVNPILYSLMSRKFREAFKDFLKGRDASKRSRVGSMTTSTVHSSNYSGVKLKELKQQVTEPF